MDPLAVLALWCFIRPDSLEEAYKVITSKFPDVYKLEDGDLVLIPGHQLSEAQMREFKEAMGEKVVLLEQKGGELVFLPPGWAHCVLMLQSCCKVAHDRYIPERFPLYALAQSEVGSGKCMIKVEGAADYMSWPMTASSQITLCA